MEIPVFWYLALIFLSAIIFKVIAAKLNVPVVTGYIIAGVLIGGSCLFFLPPENQFRRLFFNEEILKSFSILSDIAVSMVAFTIGLELEIKKIKVLGKAIFCIVVLEATGAFILVTICMYLYNPSNIPMALILGAVSSATAPAATVAVINQYKASGPLTDTILAVVGIDDAISLFIYSFASCIAISLLKHTELNWEHMIFLPLEHIGIAIITGLILGYIISIILKRAKSVENTLFLSMLLLLLCNTIAEATHSSLLLANMAAGFIVSNRGHFLKNRVLQSFNGLMPIFFAFFFILGGAHLDITLIKVIGIAGLIYLFARAAGKVSGAFIGAKIGNAPKVVAKYVGFSLLPQVGVAIALALVVAKEFGSGNFGQAGIELAKFTVNILLFTTLITEIIGPILTRYSLIKSGEAKVV